LHPRPLLATGRAQSPITRPGCRHCLMDFSETTPKGVDKVSRYDWKLTDSPGKLLWINKHEINIDETYQRFLLQSRVTAMTAKWSWIACGALVVASRNGLYWAIDGQHRLAASMRRSDVQKLPCLVFNTESVQQEAKGFLSVNVERKSISVLQRHKAMVVSGDVIAKQVDDELKALNLSGAVSSKSLNQFQCHAWALNEAREDFEQFSKVLRAVSALCRAEDERVSNVLLFGFSYINKFYPGGIAEPKIADRFKKVGAYKLKLAAKKSAIFHGGGGKRIWAKGIIDEINKGLTYKFRVKGITGL